MLMLPAEVVGWLCIFHADKGRWPTHASWHSTPEHTERIALDYEPNPATPTPALSG